jgi:hypothetical protein
MINRQKSFPNARNRQKTPSKPMLNAEDLNYDLSFSKKNQKISLNHLLNFSFPERQSAIFSKRVGGPNQSYNKERFVNAKFIKLNFSFRFVMKPGYEEQDHLTNPDLLVKWESVCQMVYVLDADCPNKQTSNMPHLPFSTNRS